MALSWSLFIQLEARVSLNSSAAQATARCSCSKGPGRMTLVSIVLWCSLKMISCAAEIAVEGTKNCLKMETSQPWHNGSVQELRGLLR